LLKFELKFIIFDLNFSKLLELLYSLFLLDQKQIAE